MVDKKPEASRRTDPQYTIYVVLREVFKGDIVQPSVPDDIRRTGRVSQKATERLKDLTKRGFIVGWIPLLSEKGAAYYEALKTLYAGSETSVDEDDEDEVNLNRRA